MESQQAQRKNEHLSLATKFYSQAHQKNYFNEVRLIHTGLPEIGVKDVDSTVNLTPHLQLKWPFYIEAMTGGSQQARQINQQLATVAKHCRLAMATGSLSIALKDPAVAPTFEIVRQTNPDGIILANLSAGASVQQAQQAIEFLHADALEIHINAAQELVMPEGDREFNWLANIKQLIANLSVPVIIKEVGFGMSRETITQLTQAGAKIINISGRGGTNFAMIEDRRNHYGNFSSLYNWGQTTPESLLEARTSGTSSKIIASGGISSPLEVIKAGVLGAQAVGVAGFFLQILVQDGPAALEQTIINWQTELIRLLTLLGCHRFSDLTKLPFVLQGDLYTYALQRKLI